jgi:predicted regulator of Ras-like GTPase activity (Roadblock/LC7/MglB family)
MEVAEALAELVELSSQVERAVVLGTDEAVLGSTLEDSGAAEALARAARDLVAAATDLRGSSSEVTRVEVELAEGAVFVIREGETTIAATTPPRPTSGLVAYDLRTCLHAIAESKPKRKHAGRKKAERVE